MNIMKTYFINIKELSIILNMSKKTLYKLFKCNNGKHEIDLDTLLLKSKISNFKFSFELDNTSFVSRMIKPIHEDDLPSILRTKDIIELTGFSKYKISYIRKKELIKYNVIEDNRYNKNAKGRLQYLYDKESFLNYVKDHKIKLKNVDTIFTKQFYSTKDTLHYLFNYKKIKVSQRTLHRYIYKNLIPAIKIGETIRIPILEFTNLNIESIFSKLDSNNSINS